ncbi:MAG: hypothetical protein IPN47_21105 [Gemmatimonadetes bacterium]|nr:hypothetical protein [Gemmatimonadota bacterium]
MHLIPSLCVMALFAIGNLLLKQERAELPRATRASVGAVLVALAAVLVALIGNVLLEPLNLQIFLLYFLIALGAVTLMFLRVTILRLLLSTSQRFVAHLFQLNAGLRGRVGNDCAASGIAAWCASPRGRHRRAQPGGALRARNEQTSRLTVVHVYDASNEIPPGLAEQLRLIDRLYPSLRIDFLAVRGRLARS